MTEKEFLKEHPSLKGKISYIDHIMDMIPKNLKKSVKITMKPKKIIGFTAEDVHETQLDKQKVEKVIRDKINQVDLIIQPGQQAGKNIKNFLLRMLKELGL